MKITDNSFNLKEYPYLTNNYYSVYKSAVRQGLGFVDKDMMHGREIYEIWDEKVFLQACDI